MDIIFLNEQTTYPQVNLKITCEYHFDTYQKHPKHVSINQEFITKTGLHHFIKTHYSTQGSFKPWKNPLKQSLLLNLSYSTLDISFNQRYHLAHAFKMQYAYPLLDKDLLTYYLALPVDQLHKNGQGRSMVRRSVPDYVPEVISKRESKYSSSPFMDTHVLREIPWLQSQWAKWKDHPIIPEIIDLEQMKQDIEGLAREDMGNFVYLMRPLQLCFFLYDIF